MTWKTHARQNNDRLLEFVSLLNGTCLVRKFEGMLFLKMEFGVRLKSGWLFFFNVVDKIIHNIVVNVNKGAVAGSQNGEKERTKNKSAKAVGENLVLAFLVSLSFFLLSNPVLPGSIHIPSTHRRSLLEYFMKKESAELQVGAFPNILFKCSASRPIRSRPLGSSPDKLCGLAPEPQPLFFCVVVVV